MDMGVLETPNGFSVVPSGLCPIARLKFEGAVYSIIRLVHKEYSLYWGRNMRN